MLTTYEKLIQGLLEKGFESVDDWLSFDDLDCLRKSLLSHYENEVFHMAGIGNKVNLNTVEAIRNDRIYWLNESLANAGEKMVINKIDDFVKYLNRTCFTGIHSFEMHYAVYESGSYYKKHVDRFKNDDRRQFSMVFYLTESWKAGDGGELLLYNSEVPTKIEPMPGRMVFFRSDIPHEVLTSQVQRFSLTGWMKNS